MLKLTCDLPYDKHLLIDMIVYQNNVYRICLEKSFFKCQNLDQYFIKIYDKDMHCVGYIYFYLDFNTKDCRYIGMYVKDAYRGLGFASLLMSYWLNICIDNDFYSCNTNKKQRKPFLLYLLKTYGFEIPDTSLYITSPHLISIYKDLDSTEKCLLFKNERQAETFRQGTIMDGDNYQIISSPSLSHIHLDDVLLTHKYALQDLDGAYNKSNLVLSRCERKLIK
ncbi:MAG: GNAT family N-acetyltransferase [Ruminococcus sp.]|nr:GNAT family N-acetyltransferase [Ruminococcus sp.]